VSGQDQPLWQVALDHIADDAFINLLYPYDELHVLHVLQDVAAMGEEPSVEEFRGYLRTKRDSWGESEKKVCLAWKKLFRNPGHRFKALRGYEYRDQPFFTIERLIEERRMEPGIRERIAGVFHRRVDQLVDAADSGSRVEYDDARHLFGLVRYSIVELRRGPLWRTAR
jgi:hypothetical protein